MSDIIKQTVKNKMDDREARWRESLSVLYHRARRRFIRVVLILALSYSFVFYTPFIWWLAEPLKISQPPDKADAIVVFAGGVGESGKAGQGYEERVQQAVDLYQKGFAKNIIFSSGYMHVFKEPIVMQALAISLGVPKGAITLEDEAKNTYENVILSKRILDKNNWHKIILISSPYHMRRASLILKKLDGNIKVIYYPIKNNFFYAHPERDENGRRIWLRINLQQIKGIIHEYLGIAYYWWRGYI